MNLAKYKKLQHELDEAAERAEVAEQALAKMRVKARTETQGAAGARPPAKVSTIITPLKRSFYSLGT